MSRDVIKTVMAPAAIGPYSQAIATETMIFASGQVPVDPATGALVEGGIEEQTKQALTNLEVVLMTGGCSLADVAKTTVFMTDLGEFKAMNEVYASFFATEPPARATIQVAALPLGARVEIEAVAIKPD